MQDERRISTDGLLKIGDLARLTSTSLTTLKYYIREGLIRPAVKTGKNMSWYDPSCVETVNLIRVLQKERFYPLNVIRDLLETETLKRPPEMDLLDAIHKVDTGSVPKKFTMEEVIRLSGLGEEQISLLSQERLIPASKKKRQDVYTEEDLAVMQLVRRRLDAGIPLEQSAAALRTFDRALRSAARNDIDLFVELIMQPDFTAEAAAHMIRVSDETLDEFVNLRRKEYNRNHGKAYIEKLYRFLAQCAAVPARLEAVFLRHGLTEAASLCRDASASEPAEECLRMFLGIAADQKSDLITKIQACQRSREFFSSDIAFDVDCSPEVKVFMDSLRFIWLTLAPEALGCEYAAQNAKSWENVDELTWKITLQDGVKFSSGRDMDAEAVKQCLEHLIDV
ncbi:MAG: MerR family transcriptional regulator, partial [Mogibacterium sp.]|nr:MerR family transcriptional regulator [Mogibacterium sp.]